MKITSESIRSGSEFQFQTKPERAAAANFIALNGDEVIVTRYAAELFQLPDKTQMIANWHGVNRTDAFLLTVGDLKMKVS